MMTLTLRRSAAVSRTVVLFSLMVATLHQRGRQCPSFVLDLTQAQTGHRRRCERVPKLIEAPRFERTPIPLGRHVLTLKQVKDHEGPNTFEAPVLNEETGAMEQPMRYEWIWQFESEKVDLKTKRPYEFAVFTPRFYSATSTTNKLTLLMRQLAPDATDEERKGMIEMDFLIGKRWTARRVTARSKSGREYTTYNIFEPLDEVPPFDPDLPVYALEDARI